MDFSNQRAFFLTNVVKSEKALIFYTIKSGITVITDSINKRKALPNGRALYKVL